MRDERLVVLFVCSGNICRSPFGAALLSKELEACGLDGVLVESAGTLEMDGRGSAPFAIKVALDYDIDLSKHRSRAVDRALLEDSDLIVAMEEAHSDHISGLVPEARGKTMVLSIPDPFGLDKKSYELAFGQIQKAMPTILNKVKELSSKGPR